MNKYAAALDLGCGKVALAVGEQTSSGIRIVSYHDAPSVGIEYGEIVNDMKVEELVRSLVSQTEAELQEKIDRVTVGLSGRGIHCIDDPEQVTRPNPQAYITDEEVNRIIRKRFEENPGNGEQVFEAIPQRYGTEDRIGITRDELVGMLGRQIDVDFKLFLGRRTLLERRRFILRNCGLAVDRAILSPIASARAVLSNPEMENGVALVDMGRNSTEVAIVKDNIVRYVAVIPFGGESITGDIKNVAGITRDWAEILKIKHGRCCAEYAVENKKLLLKNENEAIDGEMEISLLVRTVEARLSEIFDAVRYVIEQSGYASKLTSGIVITGGVCHHEDFIQLDNAMLGQKVRLAAPQGSIDSSSVEDAFDVYASTAVGLVLETLDPMLSHTDVRSGATAGAGPETGAGNGTLFGDDPDAVPGERPSGKKKRGKEKKEKEDKGHSTSFWGNLFSDNDKA